MSASFQSVYVPDATQASAARLGSWAALLLALLTVAAFAIGLFTPPRSGPFCTGDCVAYPYTDAVRFVPRDFIWMAPAILLLPLFVVLAGCIHACADGARQYLTRIGLCFASIAAAVITLDYFVQMEVIQPSLLQGEAGGIAIFSQYNPHGIFIALEDLGYLLLSLAFLFVAFAFPRSRGIPRVLRWTFLTAGLLAFGSFVSVSWIYGFDVGFRFELAVITIDWTALIVAGILLWIHFRRLASAALRRAATS